MASSNIPSLDGLRGDLGKLILTIGGSWFDADDNRCNDFVGRDGIESVVAMGAFFTCVIVNNQYLS